MIVELYGESSLTGYQLQPGESVPERLQALMPGSTVVSYAVNGTTTREMLDGTDGRDIPFSRQMTGSQADVVVLARGGNEAYRDISVAVFRANLSLAIYLAREADKRVVLVTGYLTQTELLPDGEWGTDEFQVELDARILVMAQVVRDLAAQYDLSCVDAVQISEKMKAAGIPWLIPDMAHPNAALSQRIAAAIAEILGGHMSSYLFTEQADGRFVMTTSGAPTVPPDVPPVTPPVTPPPVTPPPAPAPSGMWDLHPMQLWPVPPLVGSTISVSFVADAVRYPNGITIEGRDEPGGSLSGEHPAKDYVISSWQGSFVPVGDNPLGQMIGAGSVGGPIYCRFGPARPRTAWGGLITLPTLDLPLTPGETYWINVRAHDGSGAVVSTQFVCKARTD